MSEIDEADGYGEGRREQSTIVFPYLDLDSAVEVARAVYNRSGLGVCNLDELAAEMGQTMSGAFRMKTGTARIFDLVERDGKSSIKLSELGRSIVRADTEREARSEAFLRVPLYAKIFEAYRGHLLPPPKALEREMQSLGVSSKQTDKARQAFERSARQAGYNESGDDRLVRPRVDEFAAPNARKSVPADSDGAPEQDVIPAPLARNKYHPFVEGLLNELPQTDKFNQWSIQDQAEWLTAAAGIFKLLSKSKGRINITLDAPQDSGG